MNVTLNNPLLDDNTGEDSPSPEISSGVPIELHTWKYCDLGPCRPFVAVFPVGSLVHTVNVTKVVLVFYQIVRVTWVALVPFSTIITSLFHLILVNDAHLQLLTELGRHQIKSCPSTVGNRSWRCLTPSFGSRRALVAPNWVGYSVNRIPTTTRLPVHS